VSRLTTADDLATADDCPEAEKLGSQG
jgi:hypothetical protein